MSGADITSTLRRDGHTVTQLTAKDGSHYSVESTSTSWDFIPISKIDGKQLTVHLDIQTGKDALRLWNANKWSMLLVANGSHFLPDQTWYARKRGWVRIRDTFDVSVLEITSH